MNIIGSSRALLLVVAVTSPGLLACSPAGASRGTPFAADAGGGAPGEAGGDAAPGAASEAGSGDGGADAPADARAPTTVSGHAVSSVDVTQPLVARTVVVLDATGKASWTTTSLTGAFTAPGVVPPYDVVVAAPSWPGGHRVAFLGATTVHPRVWGLPDEMPAAAPWKSAVADIPLDEPACGSNPCSLDVTAGDPAHPADIGIGAQWSHYQSAGQVTNVLGVAWQPPATSLAVDIDVLVSDASSTHFWLGSLSGVTLTAGQSTTTAPVAPTPLSMVGMTTVTAAEVDVPAQWPPPSLGLYLVYPANRGSGNALLASATATTLVSGVPDLLGATLSVEADAAPDINAPHDPNTWSNVFAFARGLPANTPAVALTLRGAPTVTAPAPGGPLAASGTMTWSGVAPQRLAHLGFDDEAADATELEVYTFGDAIDFGRLAAAGVALTPDPTRMNATWDGANVSSIDDVLDESILASPDGTAREEVDLRFTATP